MQAAVDPQLSEIRAPSILRYLPLAIFIIAILVINPLLFLFIEKVTSPIAEYVMIGFVFGELLLVGLIGGLLGRHWLLGYSLGLAVSLVGIGVIWLVTDFQVSAYRQLPWFWRACHIPATLFVGTLPLLALRIFRQWRIAHHLHVRPSMRIENIILATSIIGSVLAMLIVPTVFSNTVSTLAGRFENVLDSSRLINDELQFAGWGALSLFLVAPLAALTLGHRLQLKHRLLVAAVHAALVLPLGVVILTLLTKSRTQGALALEFTIGLSVAYFVVTIGLVCIRSCGLRLHSTRTEPIGPNDVGGHVVWFPRVVALILLSVAVFASVLTGGHQRRAQHALETFAEVKSSIEAKGGQIDGRTFQTVSMVSFGPEMDDADLNKITNCSTLEQLDLSGSRVTDSGMTHLVKFGLIRDLDLSNTLVSDSTLDRFNGVFERIRTLNLANTKVSIDGLNRLLNSVRIGELNLSDNGLTDGQIERLECNPRTVLLIQGNPLTDACLPKLAQVRGLGLGRNEFGDQWWQNIPKIPETLLLDGVDITDRVLAGIAAKAGYFDRLRIQNTSITDSALVELSNLSINTLEIGEGKITDEGLAKAAIKVAYQLKLSGSITGSCLKDWLPGSLEALELSNSQITDETLSAITIPSGVQRLGLGNTRVSDQGMTSLQRNKFEVVDLVNTQVTANFISGSTNVRWFLVEPGKFSKEPRQSALKSGVRIRESINTVRLLDDSRQPNLGFTLTPTTRPN